MADAMIKVAARSQSDNSSRTRVPFRFVALPRTGSEFAKQLPIETGMQPQALWDGQDDLSMRDRKTDFFGNMDGAQQGLFLVAGGACTPLLAREADKHFVLIFIHVVHRQNHCFRREVTVCFVTARVYGRSVCIRVVDSVRRL